MQQYTYADLKTILQSEYDITDENWCPEDELIAYINKAIDDAESAIHTLHYEDKYFLVPATLSWVSGTQDYALPADIYGTKIRMIFYVNGETKYKIERVKKLETLYLAQSGDLYEYLIINEAANGFRLRFVPTPAETSTNAKIIYVRNMNRVTNSLLATNICEVPECGNFVIQHVRKALAKKTQDANLIGIEDADLKIQYQLMIDSLKDMTLDEQNNIVPDLIPYYDQMGVDY